MYTRNSRRYQLTVLLLMLAVLSISVAAVASEAVDLLIDDVTVIDPESKTVSGHQSVYINEGHIVAILSTDQTSAHVAGKTINANGQYLIPGLMDMHVHIAHPKWSKTTLALFLANGVTGVREMTGDCWEPRGKIFACNDDYRKLQAEILSGTVKGPRIMSLSSAIVRGPSERELPHVPEEAPDFFTPSDSDQARELVTYLVNRGVDFAKIYNFLSKPTYMAFMQAATEQGLPVAGHVPMAVDVVEAAQAGQRSIEHARVIAYDCSDYGAGLRQIVNDLFASKDDVPYPSYQERIEQSVATYNPERCKNLLDQLAAHGTWYVPTHETREFDARASEAAYRNDPRLDYVLTELKWGWQNDLDDTADASPELISAYKAFFSHGLKITGLAHAAGVKVMAGTDANDTMSIPGFSLHDELIHLVDAGLSPMDALRTATTNPAEYLERQGDFGGVSAGKKADLLLLTANPLEAIANTSSISHVVFDGHVLDNTELNTMLAEVKHEAAKNPLDEIPIVDVPRSTLQRYAGTYLVASSSLTVTVELTADGLSAGAEGMPALRFHPQSQSLFFIKEDQTTFEFIEDEQGLITGVLISWVNGRSELAARQVDKHSLQQSQDKSGSS